MRSTVNITKQNNIATSIFPNGAHTASFYKCGIFSQRFVLTMANYSTRYFLK